MSMKKTKNPGVLAVPTSSMGDIAFLLIIFFMLTSKFMQESHVKYENPASPDAMQIEDKQVSVILDSEGKLWLQGQEAQIDSLKMRIEEMKGTDKQFTVMLKIDKALPATKYSDVIKNLADTGAKIAFVGETASVYPK